MVHCAESMVIASQRPPEPGCNQSHMHYPLITRRVQNILALYHSKRLGTYHKSDEDPDRRFQEPMHGRILETKSIHSEGPSTHKPAIGSLSMRLDNVEHANERDTTGRKSLMRASLAIAFAIKCDTGDGTKYTGLRPMAATDTYVATLFYALHYDATQIPIEENSTDSGPLEILQGMKGHIRRSTSVRHDNGASCTNLCTVTLPIFTESVMSSVMSLWCAQQWTNAVGLTPDTWHCILSIMTGLTISAHISGSICDPYSPTLRFGEPVPKFACRELQSSIPTKWDPIMPLTQRKSRYIDIPTISSTHEESMRCITPDIGMIHNNGGTIATSSNERMTGMIPASDRCNAYIQREARGWYGSATKRPTSNVRKMPR